MEARAATTGSVRFGAFELDMRARELRTPDSKVRLQEQPFEILRMMLERPGDVVTREELRHRLWPEGTFVDFEHSLNAAVKRLRAALGDDAENPRFVETLPRRGYRFIAQIGPAQAGGRNGAAPSPAIVRPGDPRQSGARPSTSADRSAAVRLAVLPFDNLSDDSSQEYFSDGLTEEMISQLGLLCRGRVGVLSRWSSMVFKGTTCRPREIGEALRADYLLEGSVRREGDRVRITARLVEAAGETHLWSQTYERHLTDCLTVQADVAARIARSLAMELSFDEQAAARPTPDAAAYQAYLKGRYYWNKAGFEGVEQAIAFFGLALASAPGFGDAHAALARAHIARAEYYRSAPRQALVTARDTASRAIALDGSLSEAYLALGDATRMLEWDWEGAQAAYTQAIALNPSYESAHRGYGMMLAIRGRFADAIRETERACELDPLCLVVGASAAWARYAAGDYAAAVEHCRNTIDMDPEFMPARRILGAAYLQGGREREALAELQSAATLAEDDPVVLAWLGHAKAVTGARREATALLGRAAALTSERYVPTYHLAIAHAGLGSLDAAFHALDQACDDRDPALANLAIEPRFEPLRDDPRFAAMLEKLQLSDR